MRLLATQPVRAPLARTFEVFTDLAHSAGRVEAIKAVEIVSDVRSGKGLRWRETRSVFGEDATVEKEITALDAPRSYRVESQSDGMSSVSTFDFAERADVTVVTWTHDLVAVALRAKLMSPMLFFFKGTIAKAMEKDLADLAAFVEKEG